MKPVDSPEPVVLEPNRDPVTGRIVYAMPGHGALGTAAYDRTVQDRAVQDGTVPDGTVPDRAVPDSNAAVPPQADLAMADGTITWLPDGDGDEHAEYLSRLPEERMAAASWDQIAQTLRSVEEGRSGGADVELRPGGVIVVTRGDKSQERLSQLPQERMAAANVGPLPADVAELRRLDPSNVEGWTPVVTGLIAGWTFRLTPPIAGQRQFVFFAFRSPSDGNAYRIAVLEPDMDAEFGHVPHMISTYVGGQRIPVICGPAGAAARDLAAVRTHAAKWMVYTSARMAGRNPGFSL